MNDILPIASDNQDMFHIHNRKWCLKYRSNATFSWIYRKNLNIYDMSGKKVCSIKENIISAGILLLDKEVKTCTVYSSDGRICKIIKYIDRIDRAFDKFDDTLDSL